MKALVVITGLLTALVALPVWLFLVYKILQLVGASELMWFLFWIYAPLALALSAISGVVRQMEKD